MTPAHAVGTLQRRNSEFREPECFIMGMKHACPLVGGNVIAMVDSDQTCLLEGNAISSQAEKKDSWCLYLQISNLKTQEELSANRNQQKFKEYF